MIAVDLDHEIGLLRVVESAAAPMGCRTYGVLDHSHSHSHSHGRRDVTLVDALCSDRREKLVWCRRTWRCEETACATKRSPCEMKSFVLGRC